MQSLVITPWKTRNLRRYFYAIILQCITVSTFIIINITIFCKNTIFLHVAVLKGIIFNIRVPSKRLFTLKTHEQGVGSDTWRRRWNKTKSHRTVLSFQLLCSLEPVEWVSAKCVPSTLKYISQLSLSARHTDIHKMTSVFSREEKNRFKRKKNMPSKVKRS